VYVTDGVCGNAAPSADDFQAIVEAGGGVFLRTAADWAAATGGGGGGGGGKGKGGAKAGASPAAGRQLLLVTSEAAVHDNKAVGALVRAAAATGTLAGQGRAYKPDVLFNATMRQQLQFLDSEALAGAAAAAAGDGGNGHGNGNGKGGGKGKGGKK